MTELNKRKIVLALDWTPNTNHLGFYVAKATGLYDKFGLDVQLLSTNDEAYSTSYLPSPGGEWRPPRVCDAVQPGRERDATFALNSPEGAVNWNTSGADRPKLKAVAACLQKRTSAVVTLASSGLSRPKDLDGKVYASYGARFEGRIVRALIEADGGTGEYNEVVLPMLGIWSTLLEGKADATWVFMGGDLNAFKMEDFGIPYAYSPLVMAHPDTLQQEPEVVRTFLEASALGWQHACADPSGAASALVELALRDSGVALDLGMVQESAEFIAGYALREADGAWGVMDPAVWAKYLAWLDQTGLLTPQLQSRHPDGGKTLSLDALRAQQSKAARSTTIPLDSIPPVFTNDFLPEVKAAALAGSS
eukprot:CAMPEP_0171843594 /NCGR_PEP_ID=MMETSP0992-20121227/15962_1 /TAXON_ID=483369 /ORGANISM="non described non described, Strain CCMP2098" /LENGTH=363 /DNA_ID=CAMNT_0012461219 /DNA_START=67 /DNA_END=1160 /DNA_ORIENTATION=-